MTTPRRILLSLAVLLPPLSAALPARAQWTQPTPEELSMTAQPEVPGAPAVYLYREELTDDENHNHSFYFRIKVLSERGKEYGTVELPYAPGGGAQVVVTEITGRTIHPDGTVIPFTGKPFEKLIQKNTDYKVMAKVFSLPDIEVGSILEYRYKVRYEDHFFIAPEWYIQSKLFTRKARYQWKPTSRELITSDDRGTLSNTVAWLPMLPPGAAVKLTTFPAVGQQLPKSVMDLDLANVPPTPDDDYLPPMGSNTYRVLFYYTPYRTQEQYWSEEGKHWSKLADRFIGPGPAVRAAANDLAPAAAPPVDRLKKLYAAVMQLENTDFTRARTTAEERANGDKDIHSTDDVLTRKRGSGNQLTELFVALARAAGFKASLAAVTDRDERFFLKGYLNFSQLDSYLAIVNIDGKDQFFDPGERYMPFQHLAWQHTFAEGIRQSDKGVIFVDAPGESYKFSRDQRIADLTLSPDGEAKGTVRLTFTGVSALRWRQAALKGDSTSLDRDLTSTSENLLGKSIELKVRSIDKLTDYEEPLIVTFDAKGAIATSAGSRMLISSDLFEAQSNPTFPSKDRKFGVFFHYPSMVQDVVRIHLPPGIAIESLPKPAQTMYQKTAAYTFKSEQTPNTYTIRRDLVVADIAFPVEEYSGLRTFYTAFETQDREPVVLKAAPTPTPAGN